MNIAPVNNENSYNQALNRIFELAEIAKENTAEYDELEVLSTLVEAYENKEHPIEADPIEVIKLKLAYKGLTQKDLEGVIGSKGYISKLFNYEKPLTLPLIRSFQHHLNIKPVTLINPYPTGWQKEYASFIHYIEHKCNNNFETQFKREHIRIKYLKNNFYLELRDNYIRGCDNGIPFYEGKNLSKALELAVKKQILFRGFLSAMPKKFLQID